MIQPPNPSKRKIDADTQEIDFKQIILQYVYYWKLFVFSVAIIVLLAFIYLRFAIPLYKVDAKILLEKEDKATGELSGLSELSTLTGGSGQSTFVLDQIDILKSRRLLRKVVENNNLENTFYIQASLSEREILNSESPIKVLGSNLKDENTKAVFIITLIDLNSFSFEEVDGLKLNRVQFGESINTKSGSIVILPNKKIQQQLGEKIKVIIRSVDKAIDELMKNVLVTPNSEKQSYIINFSLTGPLSEKSKIIINNLIEQYNDDVSEDKNKVTLATTKFINNRLAIIGRELDLADKKVQDYKSSNNMTDLLAESELNLKTLSEADKNVLEKHTQVQLVDYMRESIRGNSDLQLLPTNIGLSDQSIEKTLSEYNKLVLERQDLLKSSTIENPIVKNITESIRSLNRNLITSLDNYRSVLQLSLNNANEKKGQLQNRVSAIPSQEFGFREIARQQQIVESIYLFLLQKREENEIKASARPDILKIIDPAYGSSVPVAPKKSIILLIAFIIGLIIPFVILYIKFLLDDKIHSRKDIEDFLSTPILAEIPSSKESSIKENDRSSLAESFRILRTNISFMLGFKKESSVIFVTSTTSGEGKSFVSTNLSRILAMSGKKVLLLGADIRSPKVLDYLGLSYLQHTNIGITQYLINPDMDIDNIIIKKPESYQFDIIYSGYVAPNPAELLMNGYFNNIIQYGRKNYDYVIVDTAPVSLVTDTLLIADNADLTIYVSRANYLEKKMLNVPKELYEDGKLKNMAFVINDVDFAMGYGYGYGYGYGDDYGDKKTLKNRLKRFLKFK